MGFEVKALGFEGIIDDGAIIYMNGKEVGRICLVSDVDANDWKGFAKIVRFDEDHGTKNVVQSTLAEGLSLPGDKPVHPAVSLHNRQRSAFARRPGQDVAGRPRSRYRRRR